MCGLVVTYETEGSGAQRAAEMLMTLKHRAQDKWGIASTDGAGKYGLVIGDKTVAKTWDPKYLSDLPGSIAIGQVRYRTSADSKNGQPLFSEWGDGWIFFAHNGQWNNGDSLLANELADVSFETKMDTELGLRLILNECESMPEKLANRFAVIDKALGKLEGSASLLILMPDCVIIYRDSSGCRPLVYGETLAGGFAGASEEYPAFIAGVPTANLKEVEAGTMVCFSSEGVQTYKLKHSKQPERWCAFERVYFSRHNGNVFGRPGDPIRINLGEQVGVEHPVHNADIIAGIPQSGILGAVGFAKSNPSGELAQHHLSRIDDTRAFIEDTEEGRITAVLRKMSPNLRAFMGKVVVLVDDSYVRGDTSSTVVTLIRSLGAKEVHLRFTMPPWRNMCRYGVATKTDDELGYVKYGGIAGIARELAVDSVGFISDERYLPIVADGQEPSKFCTACTSGEYW